MSDKTQETHDGLNVPALATVGLAATVVTFVIIVLLQALYLSLENRRQSDSTESGNTASVLAEQRAKLNQYGWIDREKGIAAIPIDRAMSLVAGELAAEVDSDAPAGDEEDADGSAGSGS